MIKIPKTNPVLVLNIGTKILLKDVMDTYLRSLGEVKTFYAQKLSTAVETYKERRPKIIFCEQSFPEGGALDFIQAIGGLHFSGEQYFVLAAESASEELVAMAVEKGIDEILVKPFSTDNIHKIVERCLEKAALGELDWVKALRAARQSYLEKRFQEADELFLAIARKFPENSNVQLECGEFFVARGAFQQAHNILRGVLDRSPDNARALHQLALVMKKSGRTKEAAELFARANSLSPLNTLRHMELADTYLQMADEQIQAALKQENEHGGLILTKAKLQLARKEYAPLVTYLDAKRAFLSEGAKKEADTISAIAKKLGGIK